jgi:hypothetical protein
MTTANGALLTGLAQFPNENLDPPVYVALAQIHMALRNLDNAVELAIGLLRYEDSEFASLYLTKAYTSGQMNRIYVQTVTTVLVGEFVYLVTSGGVTKCGRAIATAAATLAVGICTRSAGAYREITMFNGCIAGIFGGLTAGTMYWLSTATAGAMQNTKPAGAAIKQSLGVALDATTFGLNVCDYTTA